MSDAGTAAESADFLGSLELRQIYFRDLQAERKRHGQVVATAVSVEVGHVWVADRLDFHLVMHCQLLSSQTAAGESELADLRITVVTEYLPAAVEIDPRLAAAVDHYGTTVALDVGFPYLREGVSSLAVRLGFAVPILGLLKSGDLVPRYFTVAEPDR